MSKWRKSQLNISAQLFPCTLLRLKSRSGHYGRLWNCKSVIYDLFYSVKVTVPHWARFQPLTRESEPAPFPPSRLGARGSSLSISTNEKLACSKSRNCMNYTKLVKSRIAEDQSSGCLVSRSPTLSFFRYFQTLQFTANNWRTRELEIWRRKIVRTPERNDQSKTTERSPAVGSDGTELNFQTSSLQDFPLNIYSASLAVCKLCLTKGRRNCRGGSLCVCVDVHRSVENKSTNPRGHRLVWVPLNCWMFN